MPVRPDPATQLDRTPPFVRWTIPLTCRLREFEDIDDPERNERLLRGVRCYSDARQEQRVQGDVVVERNAVSPSRGFSIQTALRPLGGLEAIESLCNGCSANAIARLEPGALAGCVGMLVPPDDEAFYDDVDQILASAAKPEAFIDTSPSWYGLWIEKRPTVELLALQRKVLSHLGERVIGAAEYCAAIDAAQESGLEISLQAFPGGRCEGRKWFVEPHCDRCQAAWPEARRQQCKTCGQVGGRQPELRRLRMGTRPYRPLIEFLTETQITELLQRRSSAS